MVLSPGLRQATEKWLRRRKCATISTRCYMWRRALQIHWRIWRCERIRTNINHTHGCTLQMICTRLCLPWVQWKTHNTWNIDHLNIDSNEHSDEIDIDTIVWAGADAFVQQNNFFCCFVWFIDTGYSLWRDKISSVVTGPWNIPWDHINVHRELSD